MRKLKLQMQLSIDGFVGSRNWDDEIRNYSIANLEHVDCILPGRKMAKDFILYWASVAANPDDPDFVFGKKLTDIPKIVFLKYTCKFTIRKWETVR